MAIIILYKQKKWVLDWTLITSWLISVAVLVFSFHHQYIEKNEPCTLCKWQRLIYLLMFAFSPIGLIRHFNLSIRNALKFICLIGCCLATYHTLIQFGWLTDHCALSEKIENMNDFMQMLEKPKHSCATISWKLFGLSASIYNAVFSLSALIALCLNRQEQTLKRKKKCFPKNTKKNLIHSM